ncbi:uncharacterized protein BDZ99DRAFT_520773 [Mytilinidion resinicola]|uniref:F-box domain-containing protein n=1 Tax=Mytilinidion resinicola TaxID=574789 RepID=A0A6A6YLK6_9PEZI|nr:uncharacterized protein BDZ99DRAFT_520773 [Mytilinidion resinicola]KAF2809418.1 hypothetical protein BDZ99DRAFT_520773 [Mytilinidion resinicola]
MDVAASAEVDLISALPAELKHWIVGQVTNRKGLYNLCLVSKDWNDFAHSALWTAVEAPKAGDGRLSKFLKNVDDNAFSSVKLVRSLSQAGWSGLCNAAFSELQHLIYGNEEGIFRGNSS